MQKVKRVLAVIGVVILVALYVTTLVSAILATPATKDFFMASLIATIMIPILLYVYLLIYRLVTGKTDKEEIEQTKTVVNRKGFDEAIHSSEGKKDE